MLKKTSILLTATLLLFGTACGGGGGPAPGGGGGSNLVAASFVADEPNPGADTVSISEAGSSGNIVTLRVDVTDTNDVHTAAFDVVFDDNLADYVSHTAGSFLEQGGNSPTYSVGQNNGRIVVGVSRSGNSGTNATGSRTLINLNFRVNQVGQAQVNVVNASLRDGNLNDISGIGWFGGTLVGN